MASPPTSFSIVILPVDQNDDRGMWLRRSSGPGRGRPEAACNMVVDEAGALHEGVADSRADEGEAASLQVAREGNGLRGRGGDVRERLWSADYRYAIDERPDVRRERAGFFLHAEIGRRIADRGGDLGPVADDAGVCQQARHVG